MSDPTSEKAVSDLVLLSRCRAAEALGLNLSPSEVMTLAALAAERDRLAIENARLRAALAAPVAVKVKPGEIERAVWSAMTWAASNNPGFDGVPEYTDGGNSFAESEAREAAARILAAVEAVPVADVWRRAMEAAAAEVDCACDAAQKRAVLATAAPNGGPRWMACGAVDCSAMTAAAIRAIPLPADLGGRDE